VPIWAGKWDVAARRPGPRERQLLSSDEPKDWVLAPMGWIAADTEETTRWSGRPEEAPREGNRRLPYWMAGLTRNS
jgi:hypothetical protein